MSGLPEPRQVNDRKTVRGNLVVLGKFFTSKLLGYRKSLRNRRIKGLHLDVDDLFKASEDNIA